MNNDSLGEYDRDILGHRSVADTLAAYAPADLAEREEHRVDWGNFGWGCSCGAGKQWPLAPESRANAAANRHLAAVAKREWREKTRQASNAAMLRAARHAAGLDDDAGVSR